MRWHRGKEPTWQVGSWSQEDPLEEEMTTHSSILAWEIPLTEGPGRLQSMGSQEFDVTKHARQATVRNTHICCVRNKYAYLIQPSFNLILELANWRPRKVNSPRIQQVVNGGAWILT